MKLLFSTSRASFVAKCKLMMHHVPHIRQRDQTIFEATQSIWNFTDEWQNRVNFVVTFFLKHTSHTSLVENRFRICSLSPSPISRWTHARQISVQPPVNIGCKLPIFYSNWRNGTQFTFSIFITNLVRISSWSIFTIHTLNSSDIPCNSTCIGSLRNIIQTSNVRGIMPSARLCQLAVTEARTVFLKFHLYLRYHNFTPQVTSESLTDSNPGCFAIC